MKSFAEATRSSIIYVLNNNIVKTVNETINKQETNNINNMSIIMYNIKESSIEDYNSRKNEEMLYLNSIVSIISKDTPNLDNKIIDHYRLGKYDKNTSKIRPIQITFNNLQTKQFILNNAKNIKNSVNKHVNISMSLSKAEQIKLKELNTEAICALHTTRLHKRGGGISIYINNNFKFKSIEILCKTIPNKFDIVGAEIE